MGAVEVGEPEELVLLDQFPIFANFVELLVEAAVSCVIEPILREISVSRARFRFPKSAWSSSRILWVRITGMSVAKTRGPMTRSSTDMRNDFSK